MFKFVQHKTPKHYIMDYIIPTKKQPIFTLECDYIGYINDGEYKDALTDNCLVSVFARSYVEAIEKLHKWLSTDNGKDVVKEYPKAKFNIECIDGSSDKDGYNIRRKLYSISSSKAKKYIVK